MSDKRNKAVLIQLLCHVINSFPAKDVYKAHAKPIHTVVPTNQNDFDGVGGGGWGGGAGVTIGG